MIEKKKIYVHWINDLSFIFLTNRNFISIFLKPDIWKTSFWKILKFDPKFVCLCPNKYNFIKWHLERTVSVGSFGEQELVVISRQLAQFLEDKNTEFLLNEVSTYGFWNISMSKYVFKASSKSTRERFKMCSKLKIKTP